MPTPSAIPSLHLEWLPGRFAVCRLSAGAAIPAWGLAPPPSGGSAAFLCFARTDQELSLVIDEAHLPASPEASAELTAERGFVGLRLVGQIDMATVGVFATLTAALKEARVPVFLVSTYLTDYLFIKEQHAERAAAALAGVAKVDALPQAR